MSKSRAGRVVPSLGTCVFGSARLGSARLLYGDIVSPDTSGHSVAAATPSRWNVPTAVELVAALGQDVGGVALELAPVGIDDVEWMSMENAATRSLRCCNTHVKAS